MNTYQPVWAKKYIDIGFPNDWIDSVIEKYDKDLPKQLGPEISPEKYYNINLLNFENNHNILSDITIPHGYTLSEILLFLLDVLDSFGKNMPDLDSDIFELYNKMKKHKNIECEMNFEDFYIFARKLKYTNIKQTKSYKLLAKTVKYYTLNTIPLKGSTWIVPYKEGKIKIKVINPNDSIGIRIHDSKIYVKIIDVLEPINIKYLHEGMNINLRPYEFNEGIKQK